MPLTDHERTIINERFAQAMYEAAIHDRSLNYPDSDPMPSWDDLLPMAKYQWRTGALHVSTDFLDVTEQVVGHRIWQEGYQASTDDSQQIGYAVRTANPYPVVLA